MYTTGCALYKISSVFFQETKSILIAMPSKHTNYELKILNWDGSQIIDVEYKFEDTHANNGSRFTRRIYVNGPDYGRISSRNMPFMFVRQAHDDMAEVFRLLDRYYSGAINIEELVAFLPWIAPNTNRHINFHQIQRFAKNRHYT
ncbi:unnamed protein product [Rotaria socialis]